MRFLSLLLPLLSACKTNAITTDANGNTQTVAEADLLALAASVSSLQTDLEATQSELAETQSELAETQSELDAAQARIATLEGQVTALADAVDQGGGTGSGDGGVTQDDLDNLEYAVTVNLDALGERVALLEESVSALDEGYDFLAADVDALLAGSGNTVWTSSAADISYLLTSGSDWGTVTSTTITVTRTDPLIAWCQLQEAYSSSSASGAYLQARITLESDDGVIQSSETMSANTFATNLVATLTPEAEGTYTLSCEVMSMYSQSIARADLIAVQTTPTVASAGAL